jgi:hypothetical protein
MDRYQRDLTQETEELGGQPELAGILRDLFAIDLQGCL